MSKLKAAYLLEPQDDGSWSITKLGGGGADAKYVYDSFGCSCKGYKFRSSCTHQELVTNTYHVDSEPNSEDVSNWNSLLCSVFPASVSHYTKGKQNFLIKATVRAILWAQVDDIVFRLIFTPNFEEDKKEFKTHD